MDKRDLYDLVRRMKAEGEACGISGNESNPKSPDSRRTYERIWRRDQEARTGMEGVSARSWFVHRAALRWGLSERFRKLKTMQDQAQRRGDLDEARKLVEEALEVVERWKAVEAAQKPENASQSQSKRRKLPKTDDWQEAAYKAARKQDRAAVAVLWATGCRPLELERGVEVEVDQDGDAVVTIRGAKTRMDKDGNEIGQKLRKLTISRLTSVGMRLAMLCKDGPAVVSIKRRTLEGVLEEIGHKTGMKHRLSGYTFRHQVAAELKAGGDQEFTAKAMGHVSGLSQCRYGHHKQARSGTIIGVWATTEVRGLGTRFETRNRMEEARPGF